MFRPRHAYRSPITSRYRGKAKGCPVFNNITDIQSEMVEQHDECLEYLSKIKNRNELYRALVGNNKPSNNVIKSLQRLSHSASNNRLKTCLQFLIIKVNEKSAITPQPSNETEAEPEPEADDRGNSVESLDSPIEVDRTTEHSPPSPPSLPSSASVSETPPSSSSSTSSSSCYCSSSCSSAFSSPSHSLSLSPRSSPSPPPSPSPPSSPGVAYELKRPKLRLSEDKIRRIKNRPVLFEESYNEQLFAITPTTSSGCSPDQHSETTQNSDHSRSDFHTFQAPPKFINSLKPCKLPEPSPNNIAPTRIRDTLNCAICGIKDRPPNISRIYDQNSCALCSRFFSSFLRRPQQLYCAKDGDCLMTFDSRCQACWIKICLQKFTIQEEYRKIGDKFSPKLLSAPSVSLITIDTSLNEQ